MTSRLYRLPWTIDAVGIGKVFLNETGYPLSMFYVKGSEITKVKPTHEGNELAIKTKVDIKPLHSKNTAIGTYFFSINYPDGARTLGIIKIPEKALGAKIIQIQVDGFVILDTTPLT